MEFDGAISYEYIHGSRSNLYLKDLQDLSSSYVDKVAKLCCTSSNASKLLDRHNLLPSLNIHPHTILLYRYVHFVSDLTFEANHQPYKSANSKCTTPSSYHSNVHQLLAEDWFRRIQEGRKIVSASDDLAAKYAESDPWTLLFGINEDFTSLYFQTLNASHTSSENIVDLILVDRQLEGSFKGACACILSVSSWTRLNRPGLSQTILGRKITVPLNVFTFFVVVFANTIASRKRLLSPSKQLACILRRVYVIHSVYKNHLYNPNHTFECFLRPSILNTQLFSGKKWKRIFHTFLD